MLLDEVINDNEITNDNDVSNVNIIFFDHGYKELNKHIFSTNICKIINNAVNNDDGYNDDGYNDVMIEI